MIEMDINTPKPEILIANDPEIVKTMLQPLPNIMIFSRPVTPAKAGVQNILKRLDSGLRRNDGTRLLGIGQNFRQLV